MRKKELIKDVAERSGHGQEIVRSVLDAADLSVRMSIARGHEVMLFGLGKLVTAMRGPKKARHMVTGLPVIVGARRVVLFRPSDALLLAANAQAAS